jgi:hypothetical protein
MTDPQRPDVTSRLLGDDPVEDEGEDLLRRSAFAARVTDLIHNVSQETPSAVLALLGPWGSGKTSVLHFVRRRLESGGSWRVVEFNPWMLSDLPSVVQEFFTTLIAALPEDGKKLRERMAGYAKAVSPFTAPFKLFGISAEEAVRALGEVLAGDQSMEARRRDLEDALRAHGQPILLVADDLDRLHPDELTLIFKLVRLVGRLPNVYYLLAFDEKTVLDVLTSTELAGGNRPRALAYLEKMVQVRLDLPPVHPRLSAQLLDQLLNGLIAKHGVVLDNRAEYRLGQAYRTHLSSYLHEPRQVKRYCAQIEALYPLVASEVDFTDFAIITFVRTFHPGLANVLSAHKEELTGTAFEFGNKPTHEQRRDAWRERVLEAGVTEQDLGGMMSLLGQLFLPIKSALERMEYGSGFYPEFAAGRRVGSPEYFDRYFYLGIGPDDLPDATVLAALTEVLEGSPGDAWSAVLALLPTNAELVLDKLRRLAPANSDAALRLVPALASIADQVPDQGFFGRAQVVNYFWAADLLLLAEPADPGAFAEEVAGAGGVPFLADACTRGLESAENEGQAMSPAFDALRAETVRLIQAELQRQGTVRPEDTTGVISLLVNWARLDPSADRQAWMRSKIDSGAWPIPEVLGMFVPTGTTTTGDGPSRPSLGDAQLGFLDLVVGLAEVVARMRTLPEPADDSFFGGSDVSWDARVKRAESAIARWAASNKPVEESAPDAPDGQDGVAEKVDSGP